MSRYKIIASNLKQIKQELAELLEEEAKAYALRCLSCIAAELLLAGNLYVQCYDKIYLLMQRSWSNPYIQIPSINMQFFKYWQHLKYPS